MQPFPSNVVIGSFSVGLSGLLLGQGLPRVTAQTPADAIIRYVELDLADRNRPSEGRRDGGASRDGNCSLLGDATHLTALVPATTEYIDGVTPSQEAEPALPADAAQKYQSVLSLTTADRPVLWFYLPYELEGSLPLEFVLQDEANNTLYETEFAPAVAGPGVLSIPLPESVPLAEGDRVNWYLVADCTNDFNVYVEGWIERTAPPAALPQQLSEADGRGQAALYAANGIWQDALTIVANRYRSSPNDPTARADWLSLLASIDFADSTEAAITEAEILDCCQPSLAEN